MKSTKRIVLLAVAAACAAAVLSVVATTGNHAATGPAYSRFIEQVRAGQVDTVAVTAGKSGPVEADIRLKDGSTSIAFLPEAPAGAAGLLRNSVPFLLLVGCWAGLMLWKFPNGPVGRLRSAPPNN